MMIKIRMLPVQLLISSSRIGQTCSKPRHLYSNFTYLTKNYKKLKASIISPADDLIPPEPSYALWKETLPVAGKFRFHCPGDDGVGVGVGWVGDVDDGVGDGDGDGDGVGVGDVDDGCDVEDTHL